MSDSDSELTEQRDEGFITRWSRRKHVATAGTTDKPLEGSRDDLLVEEELIVESSGIVAAEEDFPTDSDMPPVESLDEDSDYSGFMSPKVSDELRNLALRKLFLGGSFSSRDGLDDYDDDFTSFEKLGDIITAEMRYQMKRVKDALNDGDEGENTLNEEAMGEEDIVEETGEGETGADVSIAMAEHVDTQGGEENTEPFSDSEHTEDRNINEHK